MNVKSLLFSLSLTAMAVAGCSTTKSTDKQQQQENPAHASRNLIIYYDEAIGKEDLVKAAEDYGATLLHDYNNLHGLAIQIPGKKPIDQAIAHFKKVNGVLSVERDQIMQIN